MTEATCETCPFYFGKSCRRFPPTPLAGAGNAFPTVPAFAWCGEHPGRRNPGITQPSEAGGPALRPAPAARPARRKAKA